MALGPDVIYASLVGEVDEFEKIVDTELSRRKVYSGQQFCIDFPVGMTHKHAEILCKRYVAAGWNAVKIFSGRQGDGDMLQFTTPIMN